MPASRCVSVKFKRSRNPFIISNKVISSFVLDSVGLENTAGIILVRSLKVSEKRFAYNLGIGV